MFPDDLATGINDPYRGTVMAKERQLNVPDLGVLAAMAKSDAEGQKRFAPLLEYLSGGQPTLGQDPGSDPRPAKTGRTCAHRVSH